MVKESGPMMGHRTSEQAFLAISSYPRILSRAMSIRTRHISVYCQLSTSIYKYNYNNYLSIDGLILFP